jgi:hypothetical protein
MLPGVSEEILSGFTAEMPRKTRAVFDDEPEYVWWRYAGSGKRRLE